MSSDPEFDIEAGLRIADHLAAAAERGKAARGCLQEVELMSLASPLVAEEVATVIARISEFEAYCSSLANNFAVCAQAERKAASEG